jgi:hypothetical protein
VLLKMNVSAFAFLAAAIFSCSPQAAITPQEAFYHLREAFQRSDTAALERQLSQGSINKIRHIASMFSLMDDRQIKFLSSQYGIPEEKFKKLSVREYLKLRLAMEREKSVFGPITTQGILGINRDGIRAVVRVKNGMELTFIKEGPYWKFDMTEL